MSGWPAVIAGILLPFVVALVGLHRIEGRPTDSWAWLGRIGGAYVLAVIGVGNLLWLMGDVSLSVLPRVVLPVLLLALVLLAASGCFRRSTVSNAHSGRGETRWVGGFVAFLLAVGALITLQSLLLPTLGWDAWNAWLAKSKAWYHAGAFLPVHDSPVWIQQPAGASLSVLAAHYPEALPRFATWLVVCGGEWRDAYVHILWPLLWGALGLVMSGLLRREGVRPALAIGAPLFLVTLPMVVAHASLPGYADLWVAALLLLSVGNAFHYLAHRTRSSLVLACIGLALLLTVKLEGAIYAALLVGSIILWRVPARLRRWTLAISAVLLVVVMPIWGLHMPVPGLGWVSLEWGSVTVPAVGNLALSWRPVTGTVLESMFLLPNWSLLWYLVLPICVLGWRKFREPSAAMLGTFVLSAAAFHFLLFFFTPASAWAEDLTSLNRLLMHVVPAWVFLLALLLSKPERLRGRAS